MQVGKTALIYACHECHIDVARMLIQELRAYVQLPDNVGQSNYNKLNIDISLLILGWWIECDIYVVII